MNIFIAFANQDRDVRDKLLRQMNLVKDRQGWNIWSSKEIKAGERWDDEIKQRLMDSEVIVLLLSTDFFNSKYIVETELPKVVEKHRLGNCQIIPVIARVCHWKETVFGEYAELGEIQALPVGEVALNEHPNEDRAYFEVVVGMKDSILAFRDRLAAQQRAEREAAEQRAAAEIALQQEQQRQRDAAARKEREQETRRKKEESARKQRENEQAAKAKAESVAWDNAEQHNTEEYWGKFLKEYPDGTFRAEAQKKLDALRKVRLDEQKRRDKAAADLAASAAEALAKEAKAQRAKEKRERLAAQQRQEQVRREQEAKARELLAAQQRIEDENQGKAIHQPQPPVQVPPKAAKKDGDDHAGIIGTIGLSIILYLIEVVNYAIRFAWFLDYNLIYGFWGTITILAILPAVLFAVFFYLFDAFESTLSLVACLILIITELIYPTTIFML